jgi:hypothetical protein
MRALAVTAAALFIACGGSGSPPPQTPSADTTSLESSGSSKDKDESKDSTPASSAAPAAAAAPAASAAPAAADAPSSGAPAASFHPAPSVTGLIDGNAFTPKVAQILAPMKKDGRIAVTITEATDCPGSGDAKGDHAKLTVVVPWEDGYKVDLSALKLAGKKGPAEISFSGKKGAVASFKPSGTVTVVSAPMEKGGKGKLKIDLQSGDYMLAGDLDVEVCVAPK